MNNEQEIRSKFIDTYMVTFIATVDANRYCLLTDQLTGKPCTRDVAFKHALKAWEVFNQRIEGYMDGERS